MIAARIAVFACALALVSCGTKAPPSTPAADRPESTAETPADGRGSSAADAATTETAADETRSDVYAADEAAMSRATMGAGATGYAGKAVTLGAPGTYRPAQAASVKAGAHDDNEEYPGWLKFLVDNPDLPMVLPADYRDRVIVRVTDVADRPVMDEPYAILDDRGRTLYRGRTYANGEAVVYPRAFFATGGQPARLVLDRGGVFVWQPSLEGIVAARISGGRRVPRSIPIDVAFILDATGSMGDEIAQLRDVLFSIHSRLRAAAANADIRFGMVVYRDRGDREPLRVVPFTASVDSFETVLGSVSADGGGDGPEDVQTALRATLGNLRWRDGAIRHAFLIADAQPHTDYGQREDYLVSAREANARGIRVHAVGASGLPLAGEHAFRQIAASTYGEFIFLTYGETGESAGTGTPDDPGKVSHHTGGNWAARRLDDIVVDLVRRDLGYQTDVAILVTDNPPPDAQEEHLALRMRSLWEQVNRQLESLGRDTLTAVLLPFEDGLADSGALGDYLRDISMETILRGSRLRLVERDRLAAVLRELEFGAGDLADVMRAAELGRLLDSRLVLSGRLYRLGTDRVVHIRAVDIETARIVAAARVRV